jgi:carboxyl-terminal processing protease
LAGVLSSSMRKVLLAAALASGALLGLSCGSSTPSSPDATANADCSVPGEIRFVRTTLDQWYLWYQQLPNPDQAGFSSPEAYLDAVRYRPLDTTFSYIAVKAESQAFFSESQFVGFGIRTTLLANDDFRVAEVFAGSPAAAIGLERGARFLEINGQSVASLVSSNQLGSVFGPATVGVTATVRFLDRAGNEHTATMAKAVVTIPTVAATRTYRVGGSTVGYVLFENFVTPSSAALDAAFAQLREAGADELVLDLRYNGGGLISVAQHLGGLIGGAATAGQPFVKFTHNDKQTARNSTLPFPTVDNALGVRRLVVVATRASASASELVVNALRPFMDVTIVGDRTYGKPVGQYTFDFCDRTLFPVSFATRNARDEGDYFDGLPANCAAPDDISHELGDPAEGSLGTALDFIRNGRCNAAAAAQAHAQSAVRPPPGLQPHRGDGWKELVGAF